MGSYLLIIVTAVNYLLNKTDSVPIENTFRIWSATCTSTDIQMADSLKHREFHCNKMYNEY